MKVLTNDDIKEAGIKYNIEPAKIKAVTLVEAAGSGFYTKGDYSGELKVRFEGHWFRKFTKSKYDKDYPHLSYPDWRLGNKFNRGINEFGRFIEAFKLDAEAAWLSTSWGMFQTMGFNYKVCGYDSVKSMIIEYYEEEAKQLEGFLNYCDDKDILDDLREGRFGIFARVYNGKDYKKNSYDTKLENYTNQWRGRI